MAIAVSSSIIKSSVALLLLLCLSQIAVARSNITSPHPPPSCTSKCGDYNIWYPFGIGEGCFRPGFGLVCNTSASSFHPSPRFFLSDGSTQVAALLRPYNHSLFIYKDVVEIGTDVSSVELLWEVPADSPYSISAINRVTVLGCDMSATLIDAATNRTIGICATTTCSGSEVNGKNSCGGGVACCRIPFTDYGVRSYKIQVVRNQTASSVDLIKVFLSPDDSYINLVSEGDTTVVPVRLDWSIPKAGVSAVDGNGLCDEEAMKEESASYACVSSDSDCVREGLGYVCYCSRDNYEGNAYLPNGCEDEQDYTKCKWLTCSKLAKGLLIGLSIGIGFLLMTSMAIFLARRWKEMSQIKIRKKHFHQNHGILLQHLISSNEDTTQRKAKIFSLERDGASDQLL